MKKIIPVITTLLLSLTLSAQVINHPYNPKADEDAIVTFGNARFTVLTSRLIRLEWSENGIFEDNATLGVVNRNLPVPKFTVKITG
ncbi:MAG: glycosyl hydrolase family 31, partial [Bacteroidales bacterium]|nr:glycosyl hydrolase family 31 [Bacteroidales bacterium]